MDMESKKLRRIILRTLSQVDEYALHADELKARVMSHYRPVEEFSEEAYQTQLRYVCDRGYVALYVTDNKFHLEPNGLIVIRGYDHLT